MQPMTPVASDTVTNILLTLVLLSVASMLMVSETPDTQKPLRRKNGAVTSVRVVPAAVQSELTPMVYFLFAMSAPFRYILYLELEPVRMFCWNSTVPSTVLAGVVVVSFSIVPATRWKLLKVNGPVDSLESTVGMLEG